MSQYENIGVFVYSRSDGRITLQAVPAIDNYTS
jgi:hypothetical protein